MVGHEIFIRLWCIVLFLHTFFVADALVSRISHCKEESLSKATRFNHLSDKDAHKSGDFQGHGKAW